MVKRFDQGIIIGSPVLDRTRGSEPHPRRGPPLGTVHLTCGRRSGGCTNIPLAAGQAQDGGTILEQRQARPGLCSVRRPASARTDQVLEDDDEAKFRCHAAFITAPSITTPVVTYFHSATRSLRASATMVVFRWRLPLCSDPVLEPLAQG